MCTHCGNKRGECSDPERDWFPQRSICWATASRMVADRMYDALHKERPYHDGTFSRWAKEFSEMTPFHYSDGVTLWVAPVDLTPDDDFLTAPTLPTGGDSLGDET